MYSDRRPHNTFCGHTRREFFWESGAGFTSLALSGLLGKEFFSEKISGSESEKSWSNPLSPLSPTHVAKARSVIFLFMYGGPSHIDTFDYKPQLYGLDGKTITVDTFGRGGRKSEGRVVGPRWKFHPAGDSGKKVSELFPNLATCVDDIGFIHSMSAESPIHGSAMLMMNSGRLASGYPCLGSWVNYGLGSANENLPGFVVMLDRTGGPISGAKNWTSGFMPASFQGTLLRSQGEPILDLNQPAGMPTGMQRKILNRLQEMNRKHQMQQRNSYSKLGARIASFELAYKMQKHAPEAVDFASEPAHIRQLYGLDNGKTEEFGHKCLLARRLVERGVRFIQVYSGGNHGDSNWDAHGDLVQNHTVHAAATDQPIAGLLKDLKQRGLLEETLVVWGGEFGRQPTAEYETGDGRDHNAYGFTMWMAGGGIRGGVSVGKTDELGSAAVESPFHVRNLHATILHQLGLNPNRLSYFFNGLDEKLVGVEGADPIGQLI